MNYLHNCHIEPHTEPHLHMLGNSLAPMGVLLSPNSNDILSANYGESPNLKVSAFGSKGVMMKASGSQSSLQSANIGGTGTISRQGRQNMKS